MCVVHITSDQGWEFTQRSARLSLVLVSFRRSSGDKHKGKWLPGALGALGIDWLHPGLCHGCRGSCVMNASHHQRTHQRGFKGKKKKRMVAWALVEAPYIRTLHGGLKQSGQQLRVLAAQSLNGLSDATL